MKRTNKTTTQPKPDPKVMTAQIIRDDDFRRFLGYLPNPDQVALGSFASYTTYREMRTDPRIKSLLNRVKTAALNYPTRWTKPAGCRDEVYQFITSLPLFSSNLYNKKKRMMAALDYGFSNSEMVWDKVPTGDGVTWIPENIITRKPERFVFDSDWNCFWKKASGEKRPLDDNYKWLTYRHNPDDENPYGTSDLRSVYWPWMFKKAGYEFWLMATEKFSVKTLIALFEMSGQDKDVRSRAELLAELIQGVASGSASALANVKDIKEIGTSGDLAGFASLVDACDVQIAYGLTGQSVATNNPTKGTQALGTVASESIDDSSRGIALELNQVVQKAINWAVELNFGQDEVSPLLELEEGNRASFEEVMNAIEHGVPISKESLYADYGLPRPKDETDAFLSPTPSASSGFGLSDSDPKKKRPRLMIW